MSYYVTLFIHISSIILIFVGVCLLPEISKLGTPLAARPRRPTPTRSSGDSQDCSAVREGDGIKIGGPIGGRGINPATGLPMVGCLDVAGNPYGLDNSSH